MGAEAITFTLKAKGQLVERLGDYEVLTDRGPANLAAFCGMCRGQQVKLTMVVQVQDDYQMAKLKGLVEQTYPPKPAAPAKDEPAVEGIEALAEHGIVANVREALQAAGYMDLAQIAEATVDQLLEIKGVGQATAPKLQELAKKLSK